VIWWTSCAVIKQNRKIAVRSALWAFEGKRTFVIQGHKKQRLVVREGVAGPGGHTPGLASALEGKLTLAPLLKACWRSKPRMLGNSRPSRNTESAATKTGWGRRGRHEHMQF